MFVFLPFHSHLVLGTQKIHLRQKFVGIRWASALSFRPFISHKIFKALRHSPAFSQAPNVLDLRLEMMMEKVNQTYPPKLVNLPLQSVKKWS